MDSVCYFIFFFFQAEDGIRDDLVTGVQTCALPISKPCRLLEAAAIVFSRQGFDATSVDQVAEEAGFSKGAVYSNFASKEELFLVFLDRHLETELQSVAAQFEPRETDGKNAGNVQQHSFAH